MSTSKTALAEPETLEYRLPRTIIPSRYQIKLSPCLDTFKFDGQVKIEIDIKDSSKEILLNSLELDIKDAHLYESKNKDKKFDAKIDLLQEQERLKLSFSETLQPGNYILEINYGGELNDKLHGFYRSTYKNAKGEQKVLATTQFEATDARRAFPCFDEPDFKAIYQVSLVIAESLQAVSNSKLDHEKSLGNGKKELVFTDTIKMSTYLVAFVIGEFEISKEVMAGKTPVRVWCTPGKLALSEFALKSGVHALNFFEKYYGVPYAGDKLDLIAIPDFAFGAMENLGCVTFRETALLVDEKAASHNELERIADVVAHEIAHMWFGDLTTMSWWNGIWLNEAFATFAEMLAVDDFRPEWKRWNTFGVSRAAAFITDSLRSTRPIEFPVRHAHECEAMFDVLTYEKGASVLRMLEQYLGKEIFAKGISHYLQKHQFANTETSDLWDAIEHVSKEPVRKMMDSWIYQKGHPAITAELDTSNKKLKLSQERFYYLPETTEANNKQLFHVPLLLEIQYKNKRESKKLILDSENTLIDLEEKPEYVIVNAGGHGFYRVRCQGELLNNISQNVFSKLSPIERFNLLNDTWAMVISGSQSLTEYLKILPAFKDEDDKNVWYVILSSLSYLERIINASNSENKILAKYIENLVHPALDKLGWETKKEENDLTKQLRASLISCLGTLGQCQGTQNKAAEYYARYQKQSDSVDPNLVPALVNILASCGDSARYDEFVRNWKEAKTPQEEERYLYALAGFKHKNLLEQTLVRTTNGEIRTQNAPYVLRMCMMNIALRELAWEHLKTNWDTIISKYPDNSIARMLEGITALVSPSLEKDVLEFIKKNPIKQGAKTIEQHLERLHVAVLFKEREGKNIKQALS